MDRVNSQEGIDEIMAEMEAKTPKPGDSTKTFEVLFEQKATSLTLNVAEVTLEKLKSSGTIFVTTSTEEVVVGKVPDTFDAKGFWSTDFTKEPNKPGKTYPSIPTNERYYDFTHRRVGTAIIFNQVRIKGETDRTGSVKDSNDLEDVLVGIGFDVKVCNDFPIANIKAELISCNLLFMTQSSNFLIKLFFQYQNATILITIVCLFAS